MPTHVFANNHEVASKAAEGKSTAAFPDVCLSPPAPPAGPIPLPYLNTMEAKDTDNGTAKVFITDKMIGIADTSKIAKSIGDEPATANFSKGMITAEIQAKGQFNIWSMNVKGEGYGFPRNLDALSQNTNGVPGNVTGMYVSTASMSGFTPPFALYDGEAVFKIYFVDKEGYQYKKLVGLSIAEKDDTEVCTVYSSTKGYFELATKARAITVKFDFYHDSRAEHGTTKPALSNATRRHITPQNSNITINKPYTLSAESNVVAIECVIDIGKPLVIFIGGAGDLWTECLFSTAKNFHINNNTQYEVLYFTYNGMLKDFSTTNDDIITEITILALLRHVHTHGAVKISYSTILKKIETTYTGNTFRTLTIVAHSWGASAFIQRINPQLIKKNIKIHNAITLDPVGNNEYYDTINALIFIMKNSKTLMCGIDIPSREKKHNPPISIIEWLTATAHVIIDNILDIKYEILIAIVFFTNNRKILYEYLSHNFDLRSKEEKSFREEFFGIPKKENEKESSNPVQTIFPNIILDSFNRETFYHLMQDIREPMRGAQEKGDADIEIFKKNIENLRPKGNNSCEPTAQPENIIKFFNVYIDYSNKSLLDDTLDTDTKVALLGGPWEEINIQDGKNITLAQTTTVNHSSTGIMLAKVLPEVKL